MNTEKDIINKFSSINFDIPILEFYKDIFDTCFIILHPFYFNPFIESYNYLNNYNLTHKLIQKITWEEIIKRTGIKDINKLALTITYSSCNKKIQNLVEYEHKDFLPFLSENNILAPYWAEDKIPEDILQLFLNFLFKHNYTEIKAGDWRIFPDNKIETLVLTKEKIFDYAIGLGRKKFIITSDYKYCLKLPYHDLPFSLFLSKGNTKYIIDELNFEGFYANIKTKIYWYI